MQIKKEVILTAEEVAQAVQHYLFNNKGVEFPKKCQCIVHGMVQGKDNNFYQTFEFFGDKNE